MVNYTLALQALKVECPLLQGGHSYVVIFRRRGLEVASHPQRCVYSGEVTMQPGSAKGYQIKFDTVKDRRTIEVSIDEVGAKGRTKMAELKFDLIDQCNVFARQAVHVIRDFPFRSGGADGSLQVSLLMFPEGSGPPAPPKADGSNNSANNRPGKVAARGNAPGGGGVAEDAPQGGARLSADALRLLSQNLSHNHIVAGLSTRTTVPEDVAVEIEHAVNFLAQQQQEPHELELLEAETSELSAELKRLKEKNEAHEREAQLRKAAHQQRLAAVQAGKKRGGGGADLSAIIADLKRQIQEAEDVRQNISVQASATEQGGGHEDTPPSDPVTPTELEGPGPAQQAPPSAAEVEYLTELRTEHRHATQRLTLLTGDGDAIQSEEALEEVGQLLDMIGSLEVVISEAEAALAATEPPPPARKKDPTPSRGIKAAPRRGKQGAAAPSGQPKRKKRVQFASDTTSGPVADTPLNRLFHHHVELERLQCSIQRLEAMVSGGGASGALPPLPDHLNCVATASGGGTQVASGGGAVASTQPSPPQQQAAAAPKANVVDDLFGPTPTAAAPSHQQHQQAPPPPAVAIGGGFDDLFAPGPASSAPPSSTQSAATTRENSQSASVSASASGADFATGPNREVSMVQDPSSTFNNYPKPDPFPPAATQATTGHVDLFGGGGGTAPSGGVASAGGADSLFDPAPQPQHQQARQDSSLFGGPGPPSSHQASSTVGSRGGAQDLFGSTPQAQPAAGGGVGHPDLFSQPTNMTPASSVQQHRQVLPPAGDVDSLFAPSVAPSHQAPIQFTEPPPPQQAAFGGGGVMDFSSAPQQPQPVVAAAPRVPQQQHVALNEAGVLRITFQQIDPRTLQGEVHNLHPHLMLEQFHGNCEGEELFGPPLPLAMKLHGGNRSAAPRDGVLHFLVVCHDSAPVMPPGSNFLLVVDGYHGQQHIQRSARLFWS